MEALIRRSVALGLSAMAGAALADGSETLGTPSIPIASGSGLVAAGVGLHVQPGTINIDVPVDAAVRQVLLYWHGTADGTAADTIGDDEIRITDGVSDPVRVEGSQIGLTPSTLGSYNYIAYRADITSLGLVKAGSNAITVDEMDFSAAVVDADNGAGLIVIYADGTLRQVDLRDGNDVAYIRSPAPLTDTVPQVFNFLPADYDRTAQMALFVTSVSDDGLRPTVVEFITDGPGGGVTQLNNQLGSFDGPEWDTLVASVNVPAGATSLSVEVKSEDLTASGFNPASLRWVAVGSVLDYVDTECGRITGGGSVLTTDARVTRGFELHCDLRSPNNLQVNWGGNRFHLENLAAAVCEDTLVEQAPPRSAPFDTFRGVGSGRYNGQAGATIEFELVDAGEPGTSDSASIVIRDVSGNLVLDAAGFMSQGNLQTHKDRACSR